MRIILMVAAWGPAALILSALAIGAPRVVAQPPQPAPESFLVGSSDIPLMPGLTEDEAATVVFDKPSGRIVIARLGGCVELRDARHFYGATLPQLGWLPAADGLSGPALTYLREGERLAIEFAPGPGIESGDDGSPDGKCIELRFLLSPASPAAEP